jgi:NAD(P) transhydrogenase
VGGVSVHTGTIPSKTLRETVLNLTGWRERGFYGRAYRVKKDLAARDLMMRLHMTLDHEVDVLEHQFARNAVQTTTGTARFLDAHRIEVTSNAGDIRIFSGERILIAVGTRPHRPPSVPFNGTSVFERRIRGDPPPATQSHGDRRRCRWRRICHHLQCT